MLFSFLFHSGDVSIPEISLSTVQRISLYSFVS